MYIFMFFLTAVLIPSIIIGLGSMWQKNPPKKINWIYGYRSSWSMKNQATWDFAHRYVGNIWGKIGVPIAIVSIGSWIVFGYSEFVMTVIMYLQLAGMMLPIIPTEVALRKNFNKDGEQISNE